MKPLIRTLKPEVPLYMPAPVLQIGPVKNPVCKIRLYERGEAVCFCGCGSPVEHRTWVRGHTKRGPYWTSHLELAEARFWQKVTKGAEYECWEPIGAHRWLYEHLRGPIPVELDLDHLCRNPCCVNPHHLEPVTPAENARRGMSPMAINGRKTHCKRGHAFDDENTYYLKGGGRACRTCRREWVRRWKERKRQEGAIAA